MFHLSSTPLGPFFIHEFELSSDFNQINTTSITVGAGTAYLSRAHEFTPGFQWGLCYSIFNFMCMFFRSLFVLLSFFAIVLSVFRFTDSYKLLTLWYLETLLKKQLLFISKQAPLYMLKTASVRELKHFVAHLSFHFKETLYRTFHKCFLPNFRSFCN